MTSRTVRVYYEDTTGEHPIEVTLTRDGREAVIETDLSDVPDDELAGVQHRAREQFWALEHAEYLRSPEAERNGD